MLLKRKEIAEFFRLTPDALRKGYEKDPAYPRPKHKLSRCTILWDEADIMRWAQRRTIREIG